MGWTTTDDLDTQHVDAAGDSPASARADIKDLFDKVSAMLAESPAMDDEANEFNAVQTIDAQTRQLLIRAVTSAGCMLALHPDHTSQGTRWGDVGFDTDGLTLVLRNLRSGEAINLITTGAGEVQINGDKVWHEGNFVRPYDFAIFAPSDIQADAHIYSFKAVRACQIPANMSGSQGQCETAPSGGAVDFDVTKNDVSVGTISFANGSNTPTFTMASQTTLAAGDRLEIIAPSNTYSMADLGIVISATQN